MSTEIGEAREQWGQDVVKMVKDYAEAMRHETKPFYIVYACKQDTNRPKVFHQTIKAYYARPPRMLGILVWFVDHKESKFEFVADLSIPHDVPLDPKMLSEDEKDFFPEVAEKGKQMNVLVS